jgi:RimJ/RimL family protein N-acetyltransferase
MTLLESHSGSILPDLGRPVLQTRRLVLRGLRLEDAAVVAPLANDRRIAENTAQIPYPCRLADAESFIASAEAKGDVNFLIALADATAIGVCGIAMGEGPALELGYWLGLSWVRDSPPRRPAPSSTTRSPISSLRASRLARA